MSNLGLIKKRYKIIKSVGDGSSAKVFLAFDTINHKEVALKIIPYNWSDSSKIKRFYNEAQISTRINNENVVKVFDIFEENNSFVIVMEYISGKNLKTLIKERGTLPKEEAIFIMAQIINAIKMTHKFNIIHRDLKPQNILVTNSGLVKVTDFGIAITPNSYCLTETNNIIGSIQYLAPEVIRGSKADERSDIYALGIIFFEMLVGALPFNDKNPLKIAFMQIEHPIVSVNQIINNIPNSIDNFIKIATAKNPSNRFGNALAFEDNLKTLLEPKRLNEKPISSNKLNNISFFSYKKRWIDNNYFAPVTGLIILFLVILLLILIVIIIHYKITKY